MLYLTADHEIKLDARTWDASAMVFTVVSNTIDILNPPKRKGKSFSVPAAKKLLPIASQGVLVIGDEFCASYHLDLAAQSTKQNISSKGKTGSQESAPMLSSPESSKRRKGSVGGSYHLNFDVGTEGTRQEQGGLSIWKQGFRVRQGFGDVTG